MKELPILIKRIKDFFVKLYVRDIISTSFLTILARGAGFLIPIYIGAWFGVNIYTDLFFFAFGIALFIINMLIPAVENIIVPFVAETNNEGSDVGAFLGAVIAVMTPMAIVALGVLLTILDPALHFMTRFNDYSIKLIVTFIVRISPFIILSLWSGVITGGLNAFGKFSNPAFSPAYRNLLVLLVVYCFKDAVSLNAIIAGYIAGESIRLLILLDTVKNTGVFRLSFSFTMLEKVKNFLKIAFFQTAGLAILGFNPIIDKMVASWTGPGSVSVLFYADRLFYAPITLGTFGVSVVLLSGWSRMYYQTKDIKKMFSTFRKTTVFLGIISLALTVVLCGFSDQITRVIYGSGMMEKSRLDNISSCFFYYTLGLLPSILAVIIVQIYQVIKKTKVLMYWAMLSVFLNLLLDIVLIRLMGIKGVALATTIATFLGVSFLYINLSRETVRDETI